MKHLQKKRKFRKETGPRRSFLRNLASDLVRSGKIETTEIRAKAIRPIVEHYVTIAKAQTLAARRLLLQRLQNRKIVDTLYHDIAPKYAERKGGYLRITKLGKTKKRDSAPLATIEFV